LAALKSGKLEVAARATFMSGEVLFEQKQHKEAIKRFYQVAYGTEYEKYKTWQANSLYEAARCFEVLKDVEKAKRLYKEVVTKFADSDKVQPAQQRLDALK
jgi:cellulose synthase operon protein C